MMRLAGEQSPSILGAADTDLGVTYWPASPVFWGRPGARKQGVMVHVLICPQFQQLLVKQHIGTRAGGHVLV